ncbi:MAG: GNAT family N-acetyltransferase [Clostridia bacterium]|nr:GNAT family N-acetyltransferase [Clostridia bacterium]
MNNEYQFEFKTGINVLNNNQLLEEMDAIAFKYDYLKEEDVLQYLEQFSIVGLMRKNNQLIGFSWVEVDKEQQIAELCWFVMDKQKAKGLEGKLLLDKTLKYCKNQNITSVKFNCASQAWGKIKNKNKLFEKFGYTLTENEKDYDISIDI